MVRKSAVAQKEGEAFVNTAPRCFRNHPLPYLDCLQLLSNQILYFIETDGCLHGRATAEQKSQVHHAQPRGVFSHAVDLSPTISCWSL